MSSPEFAFVSILFYFFTFLDKSEIPISVIIIHIIICIRSTIISYHLQSYWYVMDVPWDGSVWNVLAELLQFDFCAWHKLKRLGSKA